MDLKNIQDIEIQDLDQVLHFRIKLFSAIEGLQFVDLLLKEGKEISIFQILDDLLPLATLLDTEGKEPVKEKLNRRDIETLFKNPLSVIELGQKILAFQEVFIQSSPLFQPLATQLHNMLNLLH